MKIYKYQQLANQLKAQIDEQKWQVNEKLPSIRELAQYYQISKISVQKALHTLEARGVIAARPKSGYYVLAIKREQKLKQQSSSIEQPRLVDVPNVFYDIMQHSAAFDIAPGSQDNASPSSHLMMLNRHLSRALRQQPQSKALYYSEPAGSLQLREQICALYRKRNLNLSPEEICITSGCQNSLFLALSTCCQPGDIVAVESPAFYGVLQLLQQLKLQVIELPSSYTNGLSAQALAEATAQWDIKACIVTPNFSTPTGAFIPDDEKQELVKLANDKNITLIEDDIYGDLSFHSVMSPLKSFDSAGRVILCSSFSKSLSRDLRIGWIVANSRQQDVVHLKLINQLSNSQAIQQGVTSFLAEGHYERHLYSYRATLLKQRDQLLDAVKLHWKIATRFTVPDGGLAVWIELPQQIDTFKLYAKALSEGIVLTPGRLFSSSDKFSNHLRLSFAHPMTGQRLKALIRLGQLLNSN